MVDATYTWEFNPLECYPTEYGETDVVFTAHWQYYAATGSYSTVTIGTQALTYEAGSPFTPFNELTKEQVQGWVETAMGHEQITAYQELLQQQLQNIITPPSVTLGSPWLNPTPTPTPTPEPTPIPTPEEPI